MANGRCQHHGGHAGAAGKYSKLALRPEIRKKIEDAEMHPDLLSMRSDIALLQVRIGDLLERFDECTPDLPSWRKLLKELTDLQEQVAEERIKTAFRKIDELIEFARAGVEQASIFHELAELIEAKRKLSDSERKASLEAGHLITAAQAVTILDRFTSAVMDVLADLPERRHEIHRQYSRVLGIHQAPEDAADAS